MPRSKLHASCIPGAVCNLHTSCRTNSQIDLLVQKPTSRLAVRQHSRQLSLRRTEHEGQRDSEVLCRRFRNREEAGDPKRARSLDAICVLEFQPKEILRGCQLAGHISRGDLESH